MANFKSSPSVEDDYFEEMFEREDEEIREMQEEIQLIKRDMVKMQKEIKGETLIKRDIEKMEKEIKGENLNMETKIVPSSNCCPPLIKTCIIF